MDRSLGFTGGIVMIATGNPNVGRTEVVDVVSGKTCDDLADFPVNVIDAVGANLDGTPVVCGGLSLIEPNDRKACFKFTNSEWTKFASMKEERIKAAGIVYKKKFHIFGGSSGGTSEIISLNGVVESGPDLPDHIYFHAITTINATVSILSGGHITTNTSTVLENTSPLTWYYNHETQIFTDGPSLQEERQQHGSATIIDKVTQAKIPFVTGGKRGAPPFSTSTELLINGQWQSKGTIYLRKWNALLICSSGFFLNIGALGFSSYIRNSNFLSRQSNFYTGKSSLSPKSIN